MGQNGAKFYADSVRIIRGGFIKGRLRGPGAHKVLTVLVLFPPDNALLIHMDPRDLEFINELLEGEASLKEVNRLSLYCILSDSHGIHLHRGSANRVENMKREHE